MENVSFPVANIFNVGSSCDVPLICSGGGRLPHDVCAAGIVYYSHIYTSCLDYSQCVRVTDKYKGVIHLHFNSS